MMPIFFHLEAHLWIFYLLFVNGFLLHSLLRQFSLSYASLATGLEATVLASAMLSIGVNGALLLLVDVAGWKISALLWPVLAMSLALLAGNLWSGNIGLRFGVIWSRASLSRSFLYPIVFLVLFYNGALIEQVSDAWWHMSLTNKIALADAYTPQVGHLHGFSTRYYPPLWHGNLAILQVFSGMALPVLWNAVTPWVAVLKVMAFYLFAYGISRRQSVAALAALMFVLLPGTSVSYLRVSGWPSHIAYTAMFCLFYVLFHTLDRARPGAIDLRQLVRHVWRDRVPALVAGFLCVLIYFTHKIELLFFAAAILCYGCGWLVRGSRQSQQADINLPLFKIMLGFLLAGAVAACVWLIYAQADSVKASLDIAIAYLLPLGLLLFMIVLLLCQQIWVRKSLWLRAAMYGVLLTILFLTFDLRHLLSLFDPQLAYPMARYSQWPLATTGWFGESLKLPGWHLQLRQGLLFSGVVALPLSWWMAWVAPSRNTVFCCACISVVWAVLLSPYLYHWLQAVLDYHSPWRLAILIVHPLVMATVLVHCFERVRTSGQPVEVIQA